jgi:WD40 repeat protein
MMGGCESEEENQEDKINLPIRQLESSVLDEVYSLVFSPDSRLLAIVGKRSLELWDVASGKLVATLEGPYSASFSPDGRLLASLWLRLKDRILPASVLTVACWQVVGAA